MNYIGSKLSILDYIENTIQDFIGIEYKDKDITFCDIFAGTSSVGKYFKNKGYNVMRGEVSVWQGLYALAFFDEIFYKHNFLYGSDLPEHFFDD